MSGASARVPPPTVAIRRAQHADLPLFSQWAAREGWNPGAHDMAAFHAVDPDGFWIAETDGRPAATISVLAYDADYAFLGFYIAAPERRGRGVGKALWDAALAACPARAVGLDGVVDQQANYARSGFTFRHRNVRREGKVAPSKALPPGTVVRASAPEDRVALVAFDAAIFGRSRARFLDVWLAAPGHRAVLAERDGALVGYGVSRPCERGTKVGPLFAQDAATADALLRALCDGRPAPHVLDVPEPNAAAMALAAVHGLVPVFETARMVRGEAPADDTTRVFGVTTFEAG